MTRVVPLAVMALKVRHPRRRSSLQGIGRLMVEGTAGLTDLVESMHATISEVTAPVGARPRAQTRGLARAAYQRVRAVNRLVGIGLDAALPLLQFALGETSASPRAERLLAILNGVIGDHLVATDNPLAIEMGLRSGGEAVFPSRAGWSALPSAPTGRILVLVHGLCDSDQAWRHEGQDHGAALARDLGYTPLYLRYNSGRHVSQNGRELAALLEALVGRWPVPVEHLAILAHSMGGLVTRSACEVGRASGMRWLDSLRALVFLGTPHHGTPLERAGNLLERLLDVSAYSAPFAFVGGHRSAGIQDLRFGNVHDEDWSAGERSDRRDRRRKVPLPEGVACFAAAATLSRPGADLRGRLRGDGLVPVASALGRHEDARLAMRIPKSHCYVLRGAGHRKLLCAPAVYRRIRKWLEGAARPRTATKRLRGAERQAQPSPSTQPSAPIANRQP